VEGDNNQQKDDLIECSHQTHRTLTLGDHLRRSYLSQTKNTYTHSPSFVHSNTGKIQPSYCSSNLYSDSTSVVAQI